MQTAQTPPTAPPRPAAPLSPLAEAIITVVSTHMRAGRGGDLRAAQNARDTAFARFADLGVSPEYLRLFARVIAP